jgi:hypothetical protein
MDRPPDVRIISAHSVDQANTLLNLAVDELQRVAREDATCGILVRKTGPGTFIVELTQQVPYGITYEARSR